MKPSIGSVLYIEDDKDTRELVTLLLEQSGYELVTAENYDEALLLARTNRFDRYLIDPSRFRFKPAGAPRLAVPLPKGK
jgi:CheY-like chemotaxis protein